MTGTGNASARRTAAVEGDPPRWQRPALAAAAAAYAAGAMLVLVAAPIPVNRISVVQTLALFVCGVVIVRRTRTRQIGWLLIVPGVTFNLLYALGSGAPGEVVATGWIQFLHPLSQVGLMCLALLVLVFPTGHLESRPTRLAAGVLVVSQLAGIAVEFLSLAGIIDSALETALGLTFVLWLAAVLVGLAHQVRRYPHRPRVEQLQLKWFVAAIAGQLLYPAVFALGIESGTIAFAIVDNVATSLLPLTILVAISRYRLYDIDRLVSRTVGYGLVVAMLAVLGIGGVTAITSLLPTQDGLAVALSTVAVLALFDPLRRRVTHAVDRRFDRTHFVARQVIEGFGRDVQDVTDLDEIGAHVHAVVSRTVAPTTVAVWRPPSETSPLR